MAAKYKRHLKTEIDAWKAELPAELQFLSEFDYFAVAEQRVDGVREWCVEIQASSLKRLMDAKKKLSAARLNNRNVNSQNLELSKKVSSLERTLAELEALNTQLLSDKENGKSERSLLDAREKLDAAQSNNRKLSAQNRELRKKVHALEEKLTLLEAVNERLVHNMGQENQPKRHSFGPKETKNIFERAAEDATKIPSGRALPHAFAPKNK